MEEKRIHYVACKARRSSDEKRRRVFVRPKRTSHKEKVHDSVAFEFDLRAAFAFAKLADANDPAEKLAFAELVATFAGS